MMAIQEHLLGLTDASDDQSADGLTKIMLKILASYSITPETGKGKLQTIDNNEMQDIFPTMYICLRIYLSLLITNCSGERSFFCSETYQELPAIHSER